VWQQSGTLVSKSVRSVVPESFEVLITRISEQVRLAISNSFNVAHVMPWLAVMGCQRGLETSELPCGSSVSIAAHCSDVWKET